MSLKVNFTDDDLLVDYFKNFSTSPWSAQTKDFYFSPKYYLDETVNLFVDEADKYANRWSRSLRKALGHQAPASVMKSKKATTTSRLFPYRRTGRLQGSVGADVYKLKNTGSKNTTRVNMEFSLFTKQAFLTNAGMRTRADGKIGKWKHWVDDILDGPGRGKVESAAELFKHLSDIRSTYKPRKR